MQISVALGITKNMVVGKVRRLGLEGRPSPIRRPPADPSAPVQQRPVPAPRARAVPTLAEMVPFGPLAAMSATPAPPPRSERAIAPAAPIKSVAVRTGRVGECCWPIDVPGSRRPRFCDTPTLPGGPYCGEHAARAYSSSSQRQAVADHGSAERARGAYAEVAGQGGQS